jgi:ADP-heptose:LPS heptosyltransferase
LHGATELLKEHRPILYLENDRAHRSVELLNLLNDYGYTCFTHKPPMYNPNNYNLAPFSDRFNYVSANVLAIPQEKVHDYTSLVAKLRQSKIPSKPVLVDKRGWAGFARMGGVGDMLIAASVCRPLKELGYRVECISQEPMSCLFENNPLIDKLTIYTKDDWPKDQDSWQRWFAMRAKEYDRFANLSHSCEALHAAFPNMTQFWWPEHFRRKIFAGSYLESAHDLLNVPYTFGKLFWPTELEIEWAQEILQKIDQHPVVGWVVCGTRLDKVYPYQQQTIARLIKEVGVSVIMTGRGPDTPDYLIAEEIGKMVKAQNGTTDGLYRVGQATTKIRDVITLLQQCDLVIGPDTGPMWGVAFEAMPKIMLHSHASVENITKHWLNTVSLHADPKQVSCWPCHRLHNDTSTCRLNEYENGAACISNITPDLVLATARKLLGGRCARIPNFSAQSA